MKNVQGVEVKFTDNSTLIKEAFQKATQRGLEKAGKAAEEHAKKLCPVDTGRLRASIKNEVHNNILTLYSDGVPYAWYVECGTRKMKAQPYIKPALEWYKDEYKGILEVAYRTGI